MSIGVDAFVSFVLLAICAEGEPSQAPVSRRQHISLYEMFCAGMVVTVPRLRLNVPTRHHSIHPL